MIELKKDINRKKVPENENPNKIVDIMKKILGFNKQQKGKGFPCMLAPRPLDLAAVVKVCDHQVSDRKHIKILTPKKMLQRLPITLALKKSKNTFENLLNEIRQIIYSLYGTNEISEKVYNNMMNSVKLLCFYYIFTIFMNPKNSKTSDPHRLLLNLTDKINLKRNDKYFALSYLSIYHTWKNIKKSYKNNESKVSAPT